MVRHGEGVRPQSWDAVPGAAGIKQTYAQHAGLTGVAGAGTGAQPHSPFSSFFASTSATQQPADASRASPLPPSESRVPGRQCVPNPRGARSRF